VGVGRSMLDVGAERSGCWGGKGGGAPLFDTLL
jgi:hypothetical protein